MKILLIGATGLLSKPLISYFEKNGFELRLFSRTIDKSEFYNKYDCCKGDVLNKEDIKNALTGCDAVHISISRTNETEAVKNVVEIAKQQNIKLISYISGASVCKDNVWFEMIDNKYKAEQFIITSGISYLIFRPGWFYESIELMINNNKAIAIGKKLKPFRCIAVDDFAKMIIKAYKDEKTFNNIFLVLGTEKHEMKELLQKYCQKIKPEIKKVGQISVPMLKFVAKLTHNKELKAVAEMFGYFEKIKEPEIDYKTYEILVKPEIGFEKWLETKTLKSL